MTTIRERIETGGPDNTKWNLLTEWTAGNLVPTDEIDARIAEAVAGERGRAKRILDERAQFYEECQSREDVVKAVAVGIGAELRAMALIISEGSDHDG